MTLDRMEIILRPVTPDDREFLLAAYAASRQIELAMVPWDAATKRLFIEHQFDAQTRHYEEHFSAAVHSIIENAATPVGRLYVNTSDDLVSILDLVVLPEFRKQGIGSSILEGFIQGSNTSGLPIEVFVEEFNPSLAWFVKRGFSVVKEDGFLRRLRFQKKP